MYALIAEFDPQRAAIYRGIVEALRLEAVLVRDGESARQVLHVRGAPVLLISDLSLPRTDGFTLIADVRRISPPHQTAILAFSAFPEQRAAAWNLRDSLGISEINQNNVPREDIEKSIVKALASTEARNVTALTGQDADELLLKVMARTSRAFRAPVVILSLEMRQERRFMAHMNVHERQHGEQLWSVIQHVTDIRQPLIVPDITSQSTFGIDSQTGVRIRGFVSVPLLTSSDHLIGVISLLDFKPLTLTAPQLDLLLGAARKIADEFKRALGPELAEPVPPNHMHPNEQWAELTRLALTDPLTGLSNRRAGERALDRDVARARRAGLPFSLALIDLDHFKQVNDRFGHAVGDETLRQVSQVLAATFRASDLAVRWGGDEFLVLLPDVSAAGAMVFAERTRVQIETLTFPGGKVTVSAGVVEIGKNETPRDAIARADAYLYEMKRAGRNRVKGTP